MKWLIVVILTPIYMIIQISKKLLEYAQEIGQPIADAVSEILNNMYKFWFKGEKKC